MKKKREEEEGLVTKEWEIDKDKLAYRKRDISRTYKEREKLIFVEKKERDNRVNKHRKREREIKEVKTTCVIQKLTHLKDVGYMVEGQNGNEI